MKIFPAVILCLATFVQAIEKDAQAGAMHDTSNLRSQQRNLQRGGGRGGTGGGQRQGGQGQRGQGQRGPGGGGGQGGRGGGNGGGRGQGGGGDGGGGGGAIPATGNVILQTPSEISSVNGLLNTAINIDEATFTIPGSTVQVTSRLLNGQYPGPTLRIRANDQLQITFNNNLQDRGSVYQHNQFSANDDSNMHFHGLHISGELPSDDVTHIVYPGQSYTYETTLPSTHMGGTHWQHPHKHGSTSLQVGGGALQAVIVEDEDEIDLPDQVANAREVIFIAHYWNVPQLENVANDANDSVLNINIPPEDANEYREFVTVNGQYRPIIEVDAGEWIRLRVIWANFLQGDLDLGIDDCEMYLLAKDGIYIEDYPRLINDAQVVSGGRADIMVRCPTPNTSYPMNGIVDGLAYIQTSGTTVSSQALVSWPTPYPSYLSDLRNSAVSIGCDCQTRLNGQTINGFSFPNIAQVGERYLHTSYQNAVVARQLSANAHPYHQHVYPFQLINGFNGYNQIGDWHDTVKGTGEIRYQPTAFTGKVMLHCHRLVHEDAGMMAMEYVASPGNACSCTN